MIHPEQPTSTTLFFVFTNFPLFPEPLSDVSAVFCIYFRVSWDLDVARTMHDSLVSSVQNSHRPLLLIFCHLVPIRDARNSLDTRFSARWR